SQRQKQETEEKKRAEIKWTSIPFSAFWLRSSVASVLISLISDMWTNGPRDIKFNVLRGEPNTVACYWGSRASPMHCTAARACVPSKC
ncbi:hypothetical protein MANES_14G093601v8, partial [Manihot esculenta]